ncbi:MAG: WYL domain-containing protein [Methylotenera sp.]|nr:WYL domain-containing protein [Methylotenera sp.]
MATTISDRISDLETVLYWEGEIDNQRIRELLGVQPVWASRLMAELVKHMGDRAFRQTRNAPLRFLPSKAERNKKSSPDDYLRVIGQQVTGNLFVEDARLDLSVISPEVFIAVMQAIKNKSGLTIVYRSMNDPNGSVRQIFPHAMIRAPRRWHVRAWCAKRQDFRDFTLGRITSVKMLSDVATHLRNEDKDWNETVSFYILPHPGLTPDQQAMISAEYFPGASARKLSVRRCLAAYIIQDLRLATDVAKHTSPEYQLFVPDALKLKLTFDAS